MKRLNRDSPKGITYVRIVFATMSFVITGLLLLAQLVDSNYHGSVLPVLIWSSLGIALGACAVFLGFKSRVAWFFSVILSFLFLPTVLFLPFLVPCIIILLRAHTRRFYWEK